VVPVRLLPAAVLWDMDGTLIDTEPFWIGAETELVEAHGGVWTHEDGLSLVGNPMLVSAGKLQERGVDLSLEDIVDFLNRRVAEGVPPNAGHSALNEHQSQSLEVRGRQSPDRAASSMPPQMERTRASRVAISASVGSCVRITPSPRYSSWSRLGSTPRVRQMTYA